MDRRAGWVVRRDRVLDPAQVVAVRAVLARWTAGGGQDAAFARLFTLLLALPVRVSEALAIRAADLHLERAQPFVRLCRLKKIRKDRPRARPKADDLPLPPAAVDVLRAADDPPFPFSKFDAIRAWHRACDEAGVELPRGCAVHILRHTAATELLRRTKNLRLVQEVLGHASPTTTAGYAHVAFDEMAAALNDLWPR